MMRAQGFILLPILIFMQIFMLLGLAQLLSARYAMKNIQLQQTRMAIDKQMLQLMGHLEGSIESSNCTITYSVVDFKLKNLLWWQTHACAGNLQGLRYYYVVESLGKDACAVVYENTFIAAYFRLSVLAYPVELNKLRVIWQSTFIQASKVDRDCTDRVHHVFTGMQMRRKIM